MSWELAFAANAVMVVAYAWLASVMWRGIHEGHQWRSNPIAVATFAIFVTCTVGHAVHMFHAVEPLWRLADPVASGTRTAMSDPLVWVWEIATASVAIWYFTMRSRLEIVHGGAALCEDLVARQQNAAAMQVALGSRLADAERAFLLGDEPAARRLLDEALAESKQVITDMLGEKGSRSALGPGDLRRPVPGG